MPTHDEIVTKHAEAAAEEIKAEEAKSAEQKEVDALASEVNALSARLAPMYKFPSRYRAEIASLTAELESKQKRLDELAGKPAKDWRIHGNSVSMVIGGRIV